MKVLDKKELWIGFFIFLVVVMVTSCIFIVSKTMRVYGIRNHVLNLKAELQDLLILSPSPIKKNVAVTNENLSQIYKFRREWDRFLGNIQYSKTSIECYLNIQTEIESLQDKAKEAKVLVNPKCCFGFFKYLRGEQFPENQSLQGLDRQCQIISMLAVKLIEARPLEILSFAREPVRGELTTDDDLLNVSFNEHLNIHAIFYSNLYKLSFTGTTQTLRLFINKIQQMQIPIFIRDVQVTNQQEGKISALVEELPVFSITLELIDFKPECV